MLAHICGFMEESIATFDRERNVYQTKAPCQETYSLSPPSTRVLNIYGSILWSTKLGKWPARKHCWRLRMSGNKHIYETWEERTISEKGCRVIHYYLASTSASPLLAVVGTEKSGRHYIYKVSEEFLEAFGSSPAINAHTKWTSRKIVREWLKSLVRENNLPPTNSNLHHVAKHEGSGSLDAVAASERTGVQEISGVHLLDSTPSHEGSGNSGVRAASEPSLEPTPSEQASASLQLGDNVELLSEDLHMHGCWYRCKIMEISKRCWKVHHNDMKNEEGPGNLEQYIPPPRLACPDKLSMRHSGRLTIRPCPPEEDFPTTFEVGAAVDAWWNHGWWEGLVLTGESLSSSDNYHVFLPGNNKFLTLHRRDLRAARDWVNNIWVAVKPHPDVLTAIFSCLTQRDE